MNVINNIAAIVTGGGSGLGKATAVALSNAGAKVTIIDCDEAAAKAVADDIGGIACFADVTDSDQVATAISVGEKHHGVAQICVNCAGIAPGKRIVGKQGPMDLADFEKVIAVNLIGSFNTMRLTSAAMIKDGREG